MHRGLRQFAICERGRRTSGISSRPMTNIVAEQQDHVVEGQHQSLALDDAAEQLDRARRVGSPGIMRVEAARSAVSRKCCTAGRAGLTSSISRFQWKCSRLLMIVPIVAEHDRAAEIAGQIVEAGAALQPVGRQRAERDQVGRQIAEHQGKAAQRLRKEQFPKARLIGQAGGEVDRHAEQRHADRQHDPQIEPSRDLGGERRDGHLRQPGDDDGLADLEGAEAAHLREKQRDQVGGAVQPGADRQRCRTSPARNCG